MDFVFFDYTDKILFVRSDAESGTWTQEEMSFVSMFPLDPAKEIARGMRVGFRDELGVFQVFEIRKVRSYEPDHYQEITAEHIAVSELSDEFYNGGEFTNITPQAAVSQLITGTLWAIGTVTATNTSSMNADRGEVWYNIRSVEENWNVLITPRVEVGATGITGRYLDIAPNEGTWRGLRLSLEKNADEMGVTIDDSEVCTAMYGFGHTLDSGRQTGTSEPLTFGDVVWTETADHPAKPSGQNYIVDPTALALYGRNGRNRFGYYQNSDITDANILLQKTWESLQTCNAPKISIDCLVRDLYKLGYHDQPIRLHDKAIVEVRQWGKTFTLDVIRLSVDLFDPTATRVTIGAYEPNIIYIQRDTAKKARGGGGGGGRGQTKAEYERTEFETEIKWSETQIYLKASQNDLDTLAGVVREARIDIDAQGVQISAMDTDLDSLGNRVTSAESSLTVMAGQIESKVSAGDIASTINQTAQSVLIQASKIDLDGYVTADYLAANTITVHGLTVSNGGCNLGNSNIYVNGQSLLLGVRSLTVTPDTDTNSVTITWSDYSNTAHTVTFSKAATATIEGTWSSGTFTVSATSGTTNTVTTTIGMTAGGNGASFSVSAYHDGDTTATVATQNLVLDNGTSSAQVHVGSSSGTVIASLAYPFTQTTITPVTGQPLTLKSAAYYTGGGGSFTAQGTAGPKLSHRGTGQLYQYNSITGTYSAVGSATTDWYYVNSNGTQYYNAGTQTKHDRGGSVPVYVSDPSGTDYYQAGTAVTVYTKN